MVTIPELRDYLDGAAMPGTYSDAQLQVVLTAEAANQDTRVRYPVDADGVRLVVPDLDLALMRRVARSLAARVLPLGYEQGAQQSIYTQSVGRDPEITRLEDPYRPMVFG